MISMRERGKHNEANNTFSSFQSVPRVLGDVVSLLMQNQRLLRLLYYSDRHALGLPKLTSEQQRLVVERQIKIVPKLEVDPNAQPYVIIQLDRFVPQKLETTFRNISLSIDIFCKYDMWILDDFLLRPYAIAGEIDGMVNNSKVNGIQIANFVAAKQLALNNEIGGVSLYYEIETFFDDYEKQKPNIEQIKTNARREEL